MALSEYIVFIVNTIIIAYIVKFLYKYGKVYLAVSKVPGPKGKFIVGNFFDMFVGRHEFFMLLRKYSREHYPIYKMYNFFIVVVSLLKPDDIELILGNYKHLSKSRVYDYLQGWLGTGLLTSTGTKWAHRRKILTPAFHFNILQQFLTIFHEETEAFVKSIEQLENKSEVNILPHVSSFTLKSMTETAMGSTNLDKESEDDYKTAIYKIGRLLFDRLSKPWYLIEFIYKFSSMWVEEQKVTNTLHKYSSYVISEREKVFDPNIIKTELPADGVIVETKAIKKKRLAMLDLLLCAKRDGGKIDNDGIREEVDTFMFEGHDTTAAAVSMTLFLLGCHKDVQENILAEINDVMGDSDTPPNCDQLQEMKYLERVLKESLRLYPPVPFIARFCGEDITTTTGYKVPKGAVIHVHIFDLHRDPNTFPDPEKFDPDRFLPENCVDRHPFAYIPFSAGPRNCIGQKFALLEIKSLICGVIKKFELESLDRREDIKFQSDLILRTEDAIRMKFIPRS